MIDTLCTMETGARGHAADVRARHIRPFVTVRPALLPREDRQEAEGRSLDAAEHQGEEPRELQQDEDDQDGQQQEDDGADHGARGEPEKPEQAQAADLHGQEDGGGAYTPSEDEGAYNPSEDDSSVVELQMDGAGVEVGRQVLPRGRGRGQVRRDQAQPQEGRGVQGQGQHQQQEEQVHRQRQPGRGRGRGRGQALSPLRRPGAAAGVVPIQDGGQRPIIERDPRVMERMLRSALRTAAAEWRADRGGRSYRGTRAAWREGDHLRYVCLLNI